MLPITVVVPVKNEAKNLPTCLGAMGQEFAEVVVVDSGSTDDTQRIALKAGAKILNFQWNGSFPKKRNWVLQVHDFHTPWVLFLDADEVVTDPFIEELKRVLPTTSHAGFWLRYENWFMGNQLRYGDPMRKLALFRVGTGEYERFPEQLWSPLDMEVHEHPVLSGSVGEINAPIQHRDYRGLSHYIAKHNDYSSWEANRFQWLATASTDHWDALNPRQRFKYKHLDRWWLAWVYFLTAFILKRGFLDGRVGWVFNRMKLRYFSDIRLKIQEQRSLSD